MLGVRGFKPPCNSPFLLAHVTHHSTVCFSLLFPLKNRETHFNIFSNISSMNSFFKERTGFCAFAVKKRIEGKHSVLEMEGFDDDDIEYVDDEDEDGDGESVTVPFGKMKKWLENKPRGFGEGKEYDTSVEDKLLEEIEQSKEAQLANISKLKNSSEQPNSEKNHHHSQKAPDVVPSGIRVRLFNLPKKKNIQRDLQMAFKGVPGIVKIVPAVSGNKKTRDPVCKGFAFVDLKSEQDANRFVQTFSRQFITFGKNQKQIRCEIINSGSSTTAPDDSADSSTNTQITFLDTEEDSVAYFVKSDPFSDSREETLPDDSDVLDDEHVTEKWEEARENLESLCSSPSELVNGDNVEQKTKSATNSSSSTSRPRDKIQKKVGVKRKGEKVPKSIIPGSANRLKIKEKAVLEGVFSKYGVNTASAS